jgi:two-component system, cell cycle sensor histidine kinase and response regulator CckA
VPDLSVGLEVALSFLTAIGIGLLMAVRWRDRLGAQARSRLSGNHGQLDSDERHDSEDGNRWAEHQRTPEDQTVNYASFMLDMSGRCMTWNVGIKRLLGYEKLEFIGLPVADLYTPEDQADGILEREFSEARASGRFSGEQWIVRKDGTRFAALVSVASVLNRQGEVLGFSKRLRDLTETKRVEEELGRSKEALDLANEAAGLGTWDHNLLTGELHLDSQAKALLGFPADAPGSYRAWTAAIHPDDLFAAGEVLDRALRERQPLSTEYRVIWPDGSVHWLAVIGRGSYSPNSGRPMRMRGILLDMTERKRTEERMQEVVRLEAIGRLAGGIAHDLNNMLVAILGFSDLLAQSMEADDPRLADVQQINNAADRCAELTRQLLAFARREMIQPRKLDLNAIVHHAGGMLRPVLGENVSLDLQLSPDVGAIHADPGRVEQILMNLVLNCRDAMPRGGRVTVETAEVTLEADNSAWQQQSEAPPTGRYAMLAVTDTGHGMDPDTLQHIWEPFFTTKPTGKGTGLGLAVVYGSVKQSGGFVWVDSEVGRGTVVRVYWPVISQHVEQVNELPTPRPAERGRERILVVEDERVVRALMVRSLNGLGYSCVEAGKAEEALLVLRQEKQIDLVITDVVMPGTSGGDLGLILTDLYPALPVLYVSGFADNDVIRRGLLDASRPFLQKPFAPRELARKVREVLESPAVQEAVGR